jgi:ribose transport system substrate-binding protein
MTRKTRFGAAIVAATTLAALAGCSTTTATDSSTAKAPEGKAKIAFIMGAGSTTGNAANKRGAEAAAKDLGVDLTVLDAAFSPQKQYAQFQDAIASGKYNGIVIDGALDGAAIASLVPQAQAADIKIGAANLPIGTDYSSSEIQTEGVDVSVLTPFGRHGTLAGELTLSACEGIDPCEVGYMYIKKGSPYDTAIKENYDAAIEGSAVEIVGEANSETSAQGGAAAAQTMVTGNSGIDVLIGPEVSLLAAIPVLEKAELDDPIKLIAFGGVELAAQAIKDGKFFGVTANPTFDEGRLVIEKLVDVIENGGGPYALDTVEEMKVPDNGKITTENVDGWEISGS